jgi:acetate kinase
LGVVLYETANRAARQRISTGRSRLRVYVIRTDEEKMIAPDTVSHISATAW